MAKQKKVDVHQMSDKELTSELQDRIEEYFRISYSHTTVKLSNPLVIRILRRQIARLKTEQRMRELSARNK